MHSDDETMEEIFLSLERLIYIGGEAVDNDVIVYKSHGGKA